VVLVRRGFAAAANMRVIDPLLVQLAASFDVSWAKRRSPPPPSCSPTACSCWCGPFGDRYGKMPVVAIACIGAALCCILGALAGSLGWLTLARF
jgi:MFS family permease